MSAAPLRATSPCEHGKHHDILSLQEGLEFFVPECVDGRRKMLHHRVTAEKYPETVDRRSLR